MMDVAKQYKHDHHEHCYGRADKHEIEIACTYHAQSVINFSYHYLLQRIYARDRQWNEDQPNARFSSNAWAQRGESMSNTGWTLVADQTCRPSWDKPLEVIILWKQYLTVDCYNENCSRFDFETCFVL